MNVDPRILARPDVFRPARRGPPITASAFGLTGFGVKLAALKLLGLGAVFWFVLAAADLQGTQTDAMLASLLVQSDVLAKELVDEGPARVRLGLPSEAELALMPPDVQPTVGTRIDRSAVESLFADILEGTAVRARLYGVEGAKLADTAVALRTPGDAAQAPALPLAGNAASGEASLLASANQAASRRVATDPGERPADQLAEVVFALGGVKSAEIRTVDGNTIVSVATPVLNADGTTLAVLRLTSPPGAVDGAVRARTIAIAQVFAVAALIAVVASFAIAASAARPIRRLARAAEQIHRGGAYVPMPRLANTPEIRDLSNALHDMTQALYTRIDAIEAFAGEVAHELKNPLTSLRSAVETLPLAKSDRSRERLLEVIQHDVRRIDRLISDISEASKLDAELNRHRYERFSLVSLLQAVVATQDDLARERGQKVVLSVRSSVQAFTVVGNDSRLGQVFTNLIDNARSFTPDGGSVTVAAQRFQNFIEVVVDDEGPGIGEDVIERIFERFYTDRAEQQSFGNNSGLGLAISRQIVEAHEGELFAENRYVTTLGPGREVIGARFTVRLPVAD
jgi:two-component system sensor histidine kinase ChvG